MTGGPEYYAQREQTLVKHTILKLYLAVLTRIVGRRTWDTITYIDCFSGPWNVVSETLNDSSIGIAIQELRDAREWLGRRGRRIKLRCLFIEEEKAAFWRLKKFVESVKDVEIRPLNRPFEGSVPEILNFIHSGGPQNFSFIFVDPTGWKSIAIPTIIPILKTKPAEVLINFMSSHIHRWVKSEGISFESLFGRADYRALFDNLGGLDLDDRMATTYAEEVKKSSDYKFVCRALVLKPTIDTVHYNLIYATRSPKGVEVFKSVERSAMRVMEGARAQAQQRQRELIRLQREMFEAPVLHDPAYFESLRERYIGQAKDAIVDALKSGSLPYSSAKLIALQKPLVWPADVKNLVADLIAGSKIQASGQLKDGNEVMLRRNEQN